MVFMPRSHQNFNRVVVTGVDGSGKSTAAHESAKLLSRAYPESDIRVVDSTGLSHYQEGEVAATRFSGLEQIEPAQQASRIETVARMAGFTASRQLVEFGWSHKPHTLTIGVRDPFRVDPAVYAPIFMGERAQVSAERRLRVLHALTVAAHPAIIALLKVNVDEAYQNTTVRDFMNSHETPEKIIQASHEFPRVLESYHDIFGVPSVEINALRPNSADLLAETFEPFVLPASPKRVPKK